MKKRTGLALFLAVLLLMLPYGTAAQTPMASLSAGSGSGLPGATSVAVPVSLASLDGAQVAALNFDLSFDASRLAVGSVSIGSAASSAGKSLSSSQPAANRIRVIIFGINPTVIPDGTLAVVSFNVLAGAAPGTSSLTLSSSAASDPGGSPVPVSASDGSFQVLAPPATNTPTATATQPAVPTNTSTATQTSTATSTSAGPSPTSGGPTATNTTAPTRTRTPTPTRTPVGVSTITSTPGNTPTGALTNTPAAGGSTNTPGPSLEADGTRTMEAATAVKGTESAKFEAAVAGTATALAKLEAAVQATATALAAGDPGPVTPEDGDTAPSSLTPGWTGILLLGAVGLGLIGLVVIAAFVVLRGRRVLARRPYTEPPTAPAAGNRH
jgi:hypothetical protein